MRPGSTFTPKNNDPVGCVGTMNTHMRPTENTMRAGVAGGVTFTVTGVVDRPYSISAVAFLGAHQEALEKAIADRQPKPGLVHHSDQGVQYACQSYVDLARWIASRTAISAAVGSRFSQLR